jgi:hypothetical protein
MAQFHPFQRLHNLYRTTTVNLKKTLDKVAQALVADHEAALAKMALGLAAAVQKVFLEKSRTTFSAEPRIEKTGIVSFMKRMRVQAIGKYNQATIFSVVHYYRNTAMLRKHRPLGLVIVYVERDFAPELLNLLGYPSIDNDEDDEVLDGIGTIANLIAGLFKRELKQLGYKDLEMSHFQSFINRAPYGLEYPANQGVKYEITFDIDGQKRMVVELVMAPLPVDDIKT